MKNIFLRTVCPAAVLLVIVVFAVCPLGCKASVEEIGVLEGDFSVPHVEKFTVNDSRTLQMDFTKKIQVENARIYDRETEAFFCTTGAAYSDEGKTAFIELTESTVIGKNYVLEGLILDEHGNSLTFSIPFCGYNENPAKVILSEVRNAYGTASVKDSAGTSKKVHRSEFVELYVLKGGNLCGIEVCSAGDGDDKKFSIPSIEVKTGDYITVHMRTVDAEDFDGEGMISELGADLSLSTHEDSSNQARDLWAENTKSCFADSDIVYIKNSYDGTILDALVFAKSTVTDWKDAYTDVVNEVNSSGVWCSEVVPENGVSSDNITSSAATRSFSRQNVEQCIEDFKNGLQLKNGKNVWMITANSGSGKNAVQGVTPGFKNSSNEYVK